MSAALSLSQTEERLLGLGRSGTLDRILSNVSMPFGGWTRQPSTLIPRRYPGAGQMLLFKIEAVMPLALHAISCYERRPAEDQLYDKSLWHDPNALLMRSEMEQIDFQHIDAAKVPPALELVSDSGIYLMSNGLPVQRDSNRNECLCAFAKGYNPYKDQDWKRWAVRVLGNRRVSTVVPIIWIRKAYERGDTFLRIEVIEKGLRAYV